MARSWTSTPSARSSGETYNRRMPRTDETVAAPARTYEVVTYGCQMNNHDSERLSGLLGLTVSQAGT